MQDYIEYRKDRKLATLKARSLTELAAYLSTFPPETQLAMVKQTMRFGWQGIFDLKASPSYTNGSGAARSGVGAKSADQLEAEALARGEAI